MGWKLGIVGSAPGSGGVGIGNVGLNAGIDTLIPMAGLPDGRLGSDGTPPGNEGGEKASRNDASAKVNPRAGAADGSAGRLARPPGIEGSGSVGVNEGKLHIRARPSR